MILKITQEDIDNANNYRDMGSFIRTISCPIAISLKRIAKYPEKVSVCGERSYFKVTEYVEHTPEIIEFINKYDSGETVKPTYFIWEVPSEYLTNQNRL